MKVSSFSSPVLVDVGCGMPLNLMIVKPGSHAASRHRTPRMKRNPKSCFLALSSPRWIQSFYCEDAGFGSGSESEHGGLGDRADVRPRPRLHAADLTPVAWSVTQFPHPPSVQELLEISMPVTEPLADRPSLQLRRRHL